MNRKFLAILSLLVASLVPPSGYCSSDITAHVLKFGTYGNGNVYLNLDQTIDEPGCSAPFLEIPANGPNSKAVLATAALSVATGTTVEIVTDGCLGTAPTFTGARAAYFLINSH